MVCKIAYVINGRPLKQLLFCVVLFHIHTQPSHVEACICNLSPCQGYKRLLLHMFQGMGILIYWFSQNCVN